MAYNLLDEIRRNAALEQLMGAADAGLSVYTSGLGEMGGGLAYIPASIMGGDAAGQAVKQATAQALTYQPRTELGQQHMAALSNLMQPAADVASKAGAGFANAVYQDTQSPALAALATAAPQALAEFTGRFRGMPKQPSQMGAVKPRDAIAKSFEEQYGMPIGRVGAAMAGIEMRNKMRATGKPAGDPPTLDMESPYTDDQLAAFAKWKAMENPSSKYLFHVTPSKNIESITKHGLVVGSDPRYPGVSSASRVSMAANEEVARYYGAGDDAMIRIKKDYKFDDLEPDLLAGEGAYTTGKTIPPEALEIKKGGKWVPLLQK